MSKYHSHKYTDGVNVFDSFKEGKRYEELCYLERAGKISGLRRKVEYELLPKQTDENGKCLETPCTYVADFVYRDNEKNRDVVEDVKGMNTEGYRIKKKLMLYMRGIRITKV